MMRESVCIVLNEREPRKAKVADALERHLLNGNITVSRMKVSPQLVSMLKERSPRIVVLDYLLGDLTTGLDVMSGLSGLPAPRKPQTVFLTDEPSIPVAIQAMKLGARGYYEFDNPQAIDNVVRDIQMILAEARTEQRPARAQMPQLSDLRAQSRASQNVVEQALAAIHLQSALTIIYGPKGSGISTLAGALHQARETSGPLITVDLRTCNQPLSTALGIHEAIPELRLGGAMSVFVDHAEEDTGELLDLVSSEVHEEWTATAVEQRRSFLTLGTTSEEDVRRWAKRIPCSIIRIPSLAERTDDIEFLVQRFFKEAEFLLGEKIKGGGTEFVSRIAALQWPGEIKQLRSVVFSTVAQAMVSRESPLSLLEQHKSWWEENHIERSTDLDLDQLTVATAFQRAGGNYRICAAKLGVSISRLQKLLQGDSR